MTESESEPTPATTSSSVPSGQRALDLARTRFLPACFLVVLAAGALAVIDAGSEWSYVLGLVALQACVLAAGFAVGLWVMLARLPSPPLDRALWSVVTGVLTPLLLGVVSLSMQGVGNYAIGTSGFLVGVLSAVLLGLVCRAFGPPSSTTGPAHSEL